jgi:hypothetical protein
MGGAADGGRETADDGRCGRRGVHVDADAKDAEVDNPFFLSKRQLRRPFHDTTPLANESVYSDTDRIFHCGAALKASVRARMPWGPMGLPDSS